MKSALTSILCEDRGEHQNGAFPPFFEVVSGKIGGVRVPGEKLVFRVFPRLLVPISIVLALWMCAGRWLFGIGGWLTWWYLPTIGLTYVLCHMWVARRMKLAKAKGRSWSRGTIVSLILSWVCAIAFGIMVPDNHNGELITIIDHLGGIAWREMAIALCNPFGIIAITLIGSAVGFAIADSRDPRPEFEEPEGPVQMVFPEP